MAKHKKKYLCAKLNFFLVLRIGFVAIMATFLSGIMAFILSKLITFKHEQFLGIIIFLSWFVICIFASNLLIYRIIKGTILTVQTISDATMKVAKGDFTVQIEPVGNEQIYEVENMYKCFNDMVKELGTIETLRNDFVADVSHEFKTPISAIEGYAMLLQDESISESEKKDYLERIIYNSKRLANLTGNILMISKLDNDTVKVNPAYFSLDEQIRRIILTFEEKWNEKNLELNIDLDSVTYFGDEDMLYNVWLNLISNAIKFSKDGGLLTVKLIDNKFNIVAIVEDNGIGMNEETKKRIFEKFYQNDSSRASEGNGLGMTLVGRIIEICKGTIDIVSEENKGTKFIVTLPVEK